MILDESLFMVRMITEKELFKKSLIVLSNQYGPQGWWPRLVKNKGVFCVKYCIENTRFGICKKPSDRMFEVAIGAILTQNTAWKNVEKSLIILAKKNILTSKAIKDVRASVLHTCLKPTGYFRQKTKKLKIFACYVEDELGGNLQNLLTIQNPRQALLDRWGIGPETADTILLYGLNHPTFVVDAYTRRFLVFVTQNESWRKASYDQIKSFCERSIASFSVFDLQEAHALIVAWGKIAF